MHGILPLKSILANRHIGDSGQCPLCDLHPEDVLHMVFNCQGAANIWRELGLYNHVTSAIQVDRSGSAVLEKLLKVNPAPILGYSLFFCQRLLLLQLGIFGGSDVVSLMASRSLQCIVVQCL